MSNEQPYERCEHFTGIVTVQLAPCPKALAGMVESTSSYAADWAAQLRFRVLERKPKDKDAPE